MAALLNVTETQVRIRTVLYGSVPPKLLPPLFCNSLNVSLITPLYSYPNYSAVLLLYPNDPQIFTPPMFCSLKERWNLSW